MRESLDPRHRLSAPAGRVWQCRLCVICCLGLAADPVRIPQFFRGQGGTPAAQHLARHRLHTACKSASGAC